MYSRIRLAPVRFWGASLFGAGSKNLGLRAIGYEKGRGGRVNSDKQRMSYLFDGIRCTATVGESMTARADNKVNRRLLCRLSKFEQGTSQNAIVCADPFAASPPSRHRMACSGARMQSRKNRLCPQREWGDAQANRLRRGRAPGACNPPMRSKRLIVLRGAKLRARGR